MYGNPNLPQVIKTQAVSLSDSSAASAAFTENTQAVTVWSTANCWVLRGGSPVAEASPGSNIPIPALALVSIPVAGGEKIAGILGAAGSETLYIWEHSNV